jgi:polar amino acid transport system substrate-binding protein
MAMAGWVRLLAALLVGLALLLSGCGSVRIPADPDGTLDRVRGGVLRVGVSLHEPWTTVTAAEPGGIEPDLVRRWAAGLGARVAWTVGGEQPLVQAMERGELDLVIGGITADTPWSDQAATTRPYATSQGPDGPQEHVMLAPMGENAFLVELERYLLAQEVQP